MGRGAWGVGGRGEGGGGKEEGEGFDSERIYI